MQSESILTSIKKLLGLSADYTAFDQDITIHINTAFMLLSQLGVGPKEGFRITDNSKTWADFLKEDDMTLEGVKTYIYLKVRLVFDPPTSSFVLEAFNKQIEELEFRLNVQSEPLIVKEEILDE